MDMNLFGRLFLLFVLVPVLELALLIQMGRVVGLLPTVALVLLTGVLGASLARREGVRVFFRFQSEIATGRLPGQALFDGLCVLVGGAFLLTPGVLTDLVGFALLLPPSRRWIQNRLRRSLERGIQEGTVRVVTFSGFGAGGPLGGTPDVGEPFGSVPSDTPRDLDPRKGIEIPSDDGTR